MRRNSCAVILGFFLVFFLHSQVHFYCKMLLIKKKLYKTLHHAFLPTRKNIKKLMKTVFAFLKNVNLYIARRSSEMLFPQVSA